MLKRSTFVAGCLAAPSALRAQTLGHLTIGAQPSDPSLPPVVGVKTGIYRRYGIDLVIQEMNSGAAVLAALAGGAVQLGGTSLFGLIQAHARGLPFLIVAPQSEYLSDKPAEGLVVLTDSPIRTASDLNGKTIATPSLGDLLATATLAWIDANGGNSKLARLIELPPAATPAALEAGRVDAAALQEPRLTELEGTGKARLLGKPYDIIAKRFINAGIIAMPEFINANRDLMQRYARATLEVDAWANAHQDQTAPWLAEVTKLDLNTILHSQRAVYPESMSVADIQLVIDAAVRFKVIDKPFDARELISPIALNR